MIFLSFQGRRSTIDLRDGPYKSCWFNNRQLPSSTKRIDTSDVILYMTNFAGCSLTRKGSYRPREGGGEGGECSALWRRGDRRTKVTSTGPEKENTIGSGTRPLRHRRVLILEIEEGEELEVDGKRPLEVHLGVVEVGRPKLRVGKVRYTFYLSLSIYWDLMIEWLIYLKFSSSFSRNLLCPSLTVRTGTSSRTRTTVNTPEDIPPGKKYRGTQLVLEGRTTKRFTPETCSS